MSGQKRGHGVPAPRFVGVSPTAKDPVVSRYTADLAKRAKAAGDQGRVPIPNLADAVAQYKPGKDQPMTLSHMAMAQENIGNMSNEERQAQGPGILKPETIAGLQQLNAAVQAQNPQNPPASLPTKTEEKPAGEKKSFTRAAVDDQVMKEASDIDFDVMMRRLRNDVLNNEEERAAIEKLLKPMDLSQGLATGEFLQYVPIMEGKLEVMFRSFSPMENDEIRRHVLNEVIKDESLVNLAGEKMSFMQTVASIHSLNGKEMPRHTKPAPGGSGRIFDWDIFMSKVNLMMSYPSPLIHSLSTHAYWFDLRVRKLFSHVALKNG